MQQNCFLKRALPKDSIYYLIAAKLTSSVNRKRRYNYLWPNTPALKDAHKQNYFCLIF